MNEKLEQFIKRSLKNVGITYSKILIGGFENVGYVKHFPTTWVFDTTMCDFDIELVEQVILSILDTLGVTKEEQEAMGSLWITTKVNLYRKYTTEVIHNEYV